MAWIASARIARFRGIPTTLDLDFLDPQGRPCSFLLSGDNGSGKSTIVDALEFALQGKIGRSGSLSSSTVPSAVSLYDTSGAAVCVELTDGTKIERTVGLNDEGVLEYDRRPASAFAWSPLVLRRADILQFWETPDHQKQLLFFDYFTSGGVEPSSLPLPSHIRELEDDLANAKRERRLLHGKLAGLLGKQAIDSLRDEPELEQWITEHVYKGVASDAREALKHKGIPIKIPTVQHKLLWAVRQKVAEVAALKKEVKRARKMDSAAFPTPTAAATRAGLERVSAFVTESFLRLSSATFVDRVEVILGGASAVALAMEVHLRNGKVVSPQKIFSEANLDLLALLTYVAIARQAAERGQAPVLVLDDVFQSIDGVTRVRAAEYLVSALDGWQLFVSVHDRLWGEHLRNIFRRAGRSFLDREIRQWSFQVGPRIIDAQRSPALSLSQALVGGETYQVCAEAGLLLERLCHHLSIALPIAVTRRKEDRYTLGDLWPGVSKRLRKTDISALATEIDVWLHLRNLVGAHHNEWASSLSHEEARVFGESVIALTAAVCCEACHTWVEPVRTTAGKAIEWSCRCSNKRIVPTTGA